MRMDITYYRMLKGRGEWGERFKPKGIQWDLVTEEEMPVLKEIWDLIQNRK
ncbi:hypothetical protein ACQCT6_14735 [Cytobacillus gottheilii]